MLNDSDKDIESTINNKFTEKVLTYGKKHCIIYKHELSDETKCGYILRFRKGGGNFSGVCHGKDQAVS